MPRPDFQRSRNNPDLNFDIEYEHGKKDTAARRTPSFRLLIEAGLGLSTADWPLTLRKKTHSFVKDTNYFRDLEAVLFYENGRDIPALASVRRPMPPPDWDFSYYKKLRHIYEPFYSGKFGQGARREDNESYCRVLQQLSLTALSASHLAAIPKDNSDTT